MIRSERRLSTVTIMVLLCSMLAAGVTTDRNCCNENCPAITPGQGSAAGLVHRISEGQDVSISFILGGGDPDATYNATWTILTYQHQNSFSLGSAEADHSPGRRLELPLCPGKSVTAHIGSTRANASRVLCTLTLSGLQGSECSHLVVLFSATTIVAGERQCGECHAPSPGLVEVVAPPPPQQPHPQLLPVPHPLPVITPPPEMSDTTQMISSSHTTTAKPHDNDLSAWPHLPSDLRGVVYLCTGNFLVGSALGLAMGALLCSLLRGRPKRRRSDKKYEIMGTGDAGEMARI